MVSNDRPTCKDRHAAELIVARRDVLHSKAEYIAADLSIASKLFPCSPAADHTFSVISENAILQKFTFKTAGYTMVRLP
jgi:hypothetical protein